jgi:hypothetical protein
MDHEIFQEFLLNGLVKLGKCCREISVMHLEPQLLNSK